MHENKCIHPISTLFDYIAQIRLLWYWFITSDTYLYILMSLIVVMKYYLLN